MNAYRLTGLLVSLALIATAMPGASATFQVPDTGNLIEVIGEGADAGAACTGDPCAATKCTKGDASAHASGSQHAWASAEGTVSTDSYDGPGTAHAQAAGSPNSASATGKRDWSLKEANASCSHGGKSDSSPVDARGLIVTAGVAVSFDDLVFGCVADERIVATETFVGRFYVGDDGQVVLFDAAAGRGLEVVDLDIIFDGTTLAGAHHFDVGTMTPVDVGLTVITHDGGADADKSCAVDLTA